MGQLPYYRVNQARAFLKCGVDFFGPITMKARSGRRNNVKIKGYGAIFVCMVTRAIHIELISDLTAAEFIEGFHRFVNRRGTPKHMFSDNGTTFVAAANELASAIGAWRDADAIPAIAKMGTVWQFIPPKAPHQGGIWD